jgi:PAS domain S-box-containing protein
MRRADEFEHNEPAMAGDTAATRGADSTPGETPVRSRVRRVIEYVLVLLGVAAATGLSLAIEAAGFSPPRSALLLMAIAAAVWYAGTGPGVVAIVAASLSVEYFMLEPRFTWALRAEEFVYLFVFVAFGLLMGVFSWRRRSIEAELRRAHEELKARHADVLDITQDAIFMRDLGGAIVYWNRAATELFGYPAVEAVGRKAQDLLHTVFPESREAVQQALLRSGQWEGQLGQLRSDGKRVEVFSRWSLKRDGAGHPVAILESNNDVTEQTRQLEHIQWLNQELERRNVDLEASNKELEAFAYSVSHDLRAPLRHIGAYSALLQKGASSALDEKSRRYLANIVDASRKMGALIDDLLAFSRIGRSEARMATVSLDEVVREVLHEVERETDGRKIDWQVQPLPSVHGDRSMLRLALLNLVSNAVKFTRPRAQAEIEIGCRDAVNGNIVVFVRDNGVGFDMKDMNKLFGVFQRLHPSENFEGTGIGLATVQRIVSRHGGRVWADGVVDGGATFFLSLPKT